MALYFLTGSAHKFAEVKAVLPDIEQMEMDLDEIQELDPHKIITNKLFQARASLRHGSSLMVEDTSLYFDGMNGLPGPLVKWFVSTIRDKGMYELSKLFGTAASTKTIIGYIGEAGHIEFLEGETRGTIVEPKAESKFGWDAIFLPEGCDKTYNEMTTEEKNAVSQRGKALQKLKAHLQKRS